MEPVKQELSNNIPSKYKLWDSNHVANIFEIEPVVVVEWAEEGMLAGTYSKLKNEWYFFPKAIQAFFNKSDAGCEVATQIDTSKKDSNVFPQTLQKPIENIPVSNQSNETNIKTLEAEELCRKEYLDIVTAKISEYDAANKTKKTKLINSGLSQIQGGNQRKTVTYVETFNLNVTEVKKGAPSQGFRLDLRKQTPINIRLKRIFNNQSRIRIEGKTEKEAKIAANKLIGEKSNLMNINLLDYVEGKTLLDGLITGFKTNKISTSKTVDEMNRDVALLQFIAGFVPLKLFNDDFVLDIILCFKEASSNLSSSTINKFCCELRKTLQLCYERSWIEKVPNIPSFQSGGRQFIDINKEKFAVFTDTYSQLCSEKSTDKLFSYHYHNTCLKLFRYSGMRKANLFEMKISNIDFTYKIYRIHSAESKSNIDIDIPLSDRAMEAIQTLLGERKRVGIKSDYLFATQSGRNSYLIDRRCWKLAVQKAKLSERLSPHYFRHYFLTMIIRNGGSISDAKIAGGFKTTRALKKYLHVKVTSGSTNMVNSVE
ncbi:tyrosine-type recombinase/integrase [Paraglaciecola sp. L3A3]|uniref:tyrosine-type recombinase/integrase n=1 Tax=Paraglaciecola sp. L3A3 TaxID=2686358 RepID=UPI00131CF193|nr:tyrosine-type recombinase/integrase [Paraglaciecola sp. L3A3]